MIGAFFFLAVSVCNVKFENISIALDIQILSIKSASVAITKILVVSK